MKIQAGQTAAITGGASGIGFSIAEALADKGVNLALADIEAGALERAAAEFEAKGVQVLAQVADVSDADDFARYADAVKSRFGTPDLLFNNAGVGGGGPMDRITLDDWRWVIGVNLFGVVHGIDAFLKDMTDSGKPGHIVNTASAAGLICDRLSVRYGPTTGRRIVAMVALLNSALFLVLGIDVADERLAIAGLSLAVAFLLCTEVAYWSASMDAAKKTVT